MRLSTAQHPKESLLVELFGETAMDKYILVIPTLQHCVLVEHLMRK